jgi:glycosyltransferase involved in cell wall biosynthesis
MKVLFCYRYLTLGGVESVIRTRLAGLPQVGIEAHAWFLRPGPGLKMFGELPDKVLLGDSEPSKQAVADGGFDLITVIDTPELHPWLHNSGFRFGVESHTPYVENLTYLGQLDGRQVRLIFTPSSHQRHQVVSRLQADIPVVVVPNPVDERYLRPTALLPDVPPAPIVAWVGRLDRLKNWRRFLAIGQAVLKEQAQLELWLVGAFPHGADWHDLYRQARRRGCLERLRWYQAVPQARLARLLDAVRQSGGVLLSTSDGESFGMTVAEAMARECPVVVPDQPPFDEFVEHNVSGVRYSAGDHRQAARLVLQLLTDHKARARLGKAARQVILERHAPQVAIPQLAQILQTVIRGNESYAEQVTDQAATISYRAAPDTLVPVGRWPESPNDPPMSGR